MKLLKKTILVSCLISANFGFSQIQESFISSGFDMNHYSIENVPNKGFLCAGTLIDQITQHTDMHVIQLDQNGLVMWESTIDNSDYDEILDITYDTDNDIIAITGFISPNGRDYPEAYVATLEPSSGTVLQEISFNQYDASAGTNILYSQVNNHFIVGGFNSDPLGSGKLGGNSAFLFKLDPTFNLVESNEIFTNTNEHSSINDIIEVDNGFFVTGSVGNDNPSPSNGAQGVLALFVDDNLNSTADVSYEFTNHYHCGVSAVYDQPSDEVYLITNNSISHNPEVMIIGDIQSGTPTLVSSYRLNIDPSWGNEDVSAYQLVPSLTNNNNLVVCGYYNHAQYLSTSDNSLAWLAEFDKSNGSWVNFVIWEAPSQYYNLLGYDVLQNFDGVHGYVYNPEVLVQNPSNGSYVFIAPRRLGNEFGIDVKETILYNLMPCESHPNGYSVQNITWSTMQTNQGAFWPTDVSQSSQYNFYQSSNWSPCPIEGGNEDPKKSPLSEEKTTTPALSIHPNPASHNLTIQIRDMNGTIKMTNTLGQILYSHTSFNKENLNENIEISNFQSGIYIVEYVQSNGRSVNKRFVKL